LTFVLAWRGLLELVLGLFDKALADQLEMLRRVNAGLVTDTSSGGIGAYLATSYWSIGEGDLARLHFRMAAESDAALSVVPLLGLFGLEPAARGDVHAADQWAARAELAAEGGQWPETPQNLLMARVVRLRAAGTAAERAALLPSLQRRWPDAMRGVGLIGVPWLSYATLAAVWSGQLELAESFVDRLRSGSPRPAWSAAIAEWLTGLIAEARGDLATALGHLELAAAADPPPPLQRGYLLTDLVRLRAAQGRRDGNEELRAEAMSKFRRLGAQPSETTPPPAPATPLPPPAQPGTSVVGGYGLSERERDVVTLVSVGMSYQQIARELFITRSTVGFHLSNIYAKAGVTSRHELTALLRSNPASFGLAAVAR
jgi:DNA-binding CsgD family transcriptional regulator